MARSIQRKNSNSILTPSQLKLLTAIWVALLLSIVAGTQGAAMTSAVPNFTISPSVGSLTLLLGSSNADNPIDITVTDLNGFKGSVSLTASGVPAGVTAAFTTVDANNTSMTLHVGSTAIPGLYPVTITGKSGTVTKTTAITLTIPLPSFRISASPSSVTLFIGGAGASSAINITDVNGFASSVTLSARGLPTGVTALFGSAKTTTGTTLTLSAGRNAVAGVFPVTITGTCQGLTSSTTISVTIRAPSFSLSTSAASVTLAPGGSSVGSTVGIVNAVGLSGNVNLSISGVPTGVTAAFKPTAASTGSPSTLTLSASATAISGTYSVTVTGTSGTVASTATIAVTVAVPALPISVAITQPAYGFNVLPGSVRRVFATITNGKTNAVNWSVTGGATLSAATGNWVDVTAPATGSSCSINGTDGAYAIASAKQFTLTAQSQENPNKTTSISMNVCNPAVQVHVVPFYTTLYSGQKADIQAFVWGSTNRNVTWAIASQPSGGDGVLADAANQDTVFSATVAGRYTVVATSVANGATMNTATVYVTANSMPYQVTPSKTLPVDCTVDPALTGTTYDVGPSQAYKTIQSVPWTSLQPGSTVRIHNEDISGGSPTTFHEYFQVAAHATRTQPVRVCGVPDSRGNLPVIDASNSSGRSDVSAYSAGYTAVGIGTTGWAGVYTGTAPTSQYLIVEGLKIQNAKQPSTYTTPSGQAGTPWILGAACVRIFPSTDTVVRGMDANGCGNGFFSDFNANNGYAEVANTLYEGNHLHGNGNSGSYTEHQFYIQGWNEVVQFNTIDDYESGAEGSNFKGRGFPEILRYNQFGDGAARQIDMVDNTDAGPYTTFEGYLQGTPSYHTIYPADGYTADLLAAAVEAHHADYVYGNTFDNATSEYPIHYATDHGSLEDDRVGTLWFYNNSFYEPACNGCSIWRWYLFDTSGGGGNGFAEIEWPQIQALNNAVWMDSPTSPYFNWNALTTQFTTFGKNAVNSNWGTGAMAGGDGTGWTTNTSPYAFQGAANSADTVGISNLFGVSAEPFDVTTFAPSPVLIDAGANMPSSAPKLPVRFAYGPAAIQTVRSQPLTVGAME
jgi:uncharacterized membrane protein